MDNKEAYREALALAEKAKAQPQTTPNYSCPDGWKMVPVEPTFDMCKAGGFTWEYPHFPSRYKAMLSAAPTPPQESVDVEALKTECIEEICNELTVKHLGHGGVVEAVIDHLAATGRLK